MDASGLTNLLIGAMGAIIMSLSGITLWKFSQAQKELKESDLLLQQKLDKERTELIKMIKENRAELLASWQESMSKLLDWAKQEIERSEGAHKSLGDAIRNLDNHLTNANKRLTLHAERLASLESSQKMLENHINRMDRIEKKIDNLIERQWVKPNHKDT